MNLATSLSALAPHYDAALCDVWGVVHNGISAHPTAVEALRQFREGGGQVVFITNAPRPSAPIVAMLDRLGVIRDAYDDIVSSGDVSRDMIAKYAGKVVHHVGPPHEDDSLFEGIDVVRGPAEEAAVVVATALEHDDDTPDMYQGKVEQWLARRLPMICANPDRVVEHGDELLYCAGALADLYEAQGGKVLMAGKPYRPIYEAAIGRAEKAAGKTLDRKRVVAIGDSIRTDAMGAANFGIDFLFVTGSVHASELDAFSEPDPEAIKAFVEPSGARLAGFMPRLAW